MTAILSDIQAFATALQNTEAFSEWCGEYEDPAAHVSIWGTDRGSVYPMAIVSPGSWTDECVNNSLFYFTPEIVVEFAEIVEKTATNAEVFNAIVSSVDTIVQDLKAQQLTGYAMQRIVPDSADKTPVRAEYTAGTDYASYTIRIEGCLR
jgi:hypothetical protein